jgi:hypothetical protein
MDQKFDCRASVQGTKRKRRAKPAPSPQQLAKQYLDLQCLRQQVRIAETEQIFSWQLTRSPAQAPFAQEDGSLSAS